MYGLKYIEKTRNYLDYLEHHLKLVEDAYYLVQKALKGHQIHVAWDTLHTEIQLHDVSKFSAEEFTRYVNRFFPVQGEECDLEEWVEAKRHHFKVNPHHHVWIKPMSNTQVIHAIIDWFAMTELDPQKLHDWYYKEIKEFGRPMDHELICKVLDCLCMD